MMYVGCGSLNYMWAQKTLRGSGAAQCFPLLWAMAHQMGVWGSGCAVPAIPLLLCNFNV